MPRLGVLKAEIITTLYLGVRAYFCRQKAFAEIDN